MKEGRARGTDETHNLRAIEPPVRRGKPCEPIGIGPAGPKLHNKTDCVDEVADILGFAKKVRLDFDPRSRLRPKKTQIATATGAHQPGADGEDVTIEIVAIRDLDRGATALDRKGVNVGLRKTLAGFPVEHRTAAIVANGTKRSFGSEIDGAHQRMILQILADTGKCSPDSNAEPRQFARVADTRQHQKPWR